MYNVIDAEMCPRRIYGWRKDDIQYSLGVMLLNDDPLGNTYAWCLYHSQGPREGVLNGFR